MPRAPHDRARVLADHRAHVPLHGIGGDDAGQHGHDRQLHAIDEASIEKRPKERAAAKQPDVASGLRLQRSHDLARIIDHTLLKPDATKDDLGRYETVPGDVRTIISRRRLSLTDGQHRNVWARGLRDLREQYPEKKAALETLAEMVMNCNKNFDDSWS